MLIDIPEERGGSYFVNKWSNSEMCHFPLFDFFKVATITKLAAVYFAMWIGIKQNFIKIKTFFNNFFLNNRCSRYHARIQI